MTIFLPRTRAVLFSVAICTLLGVTPQPVAAQAVDTVQHIGAGYAAGALGGGLVAMYATGIEPRRAPCATAMAAFAAGSLAGVSKELFDLVGPGAAEVRDLAWTVVGSSVSSLAWAVLTGPILLAGEPGAEQVLAGELRSLSIGMIISSAVMTVAVLALELQERLRGRNGNNN